MSKKVRNNLSILERELNELYESKGIIVPKEAFPYIRRAMKSFAVATIYEDRKSRRMRMVESLKYLPKEFRIAYYEFFVQWIRKIYLKKAIRTAELKAFNEGYKQYVILATKYSYKIFSTRELKYNKKIRVLKKDLTAKEVSEKASRIIYPKLK